jgi:hypothetical protein
MTTPEAMFIPDGDTFIPTRAAVGPWHEHGLHGGVVGALLAGQLCKPDRTLVRVSIELLAPATLSPLTVTRSDPLGGARVQRQEATIICDGKTVALARGVTIRRTETPLPLAALEDASPFDPSQAPALDCPNSQMAVEAMGWDGFASLACANAFVPRSDGELGQRLWTSVLMPVIAGTPVSGVEMAVIAADTSQVGVARRLPFEDWTFVNAELTVHFSREPIGSWVGIDADGILAGSGAGTGVSRLYDADGRFGQSASALVIQNRSA